MRYQPGASKIAEGQLAISVYDEVNRLIHQINRPRDDAISVVVPPHAWRHVTTVRATRGNHADRP